MGKQALRMALQTGSSIHRDKATSNIYGPELARRHGSMYAVYHGPQGLRDIAERMHTYARGLAVALGASDGLNVVSRCYTDTLKIEVLGGADEMKALRARAESKRVNLRYFADGKHVGVSFNERTNQDDFAALCSVLGVSPVQGVSFDPTFFGLNREVDYLHHRCSTATARKQK